MNSSRRQFFKNAAVMVGLGALVPTFFGSLVKAEEKRRAKKDEGAAAGGDPMVKPGEGMAASVNYVLDHKDVKDAKLKTERQGVAFEKQNCSGCMLYAKTSGTGAGEVGKCQLFANQSVKGTAWCNSWAKKA